MSKFVDNITKKEKQVPERVLQQIFDYLSPAEILIAERVCRRWQSVASSPALWWSVSFRASHGGLQVA